MNIADTFLETKICDSHSSTDLAVVKMESEHALIAAPFSWLLGELQTHFPLACAALLRSTAGSQPFAQAQTVMTEAINVVMRVWHPKCYFLQGLSHISENIRGRQKNLLFLVSSPNSWTMKILYIKGIPGKQIDKTEVEGGTWNSQVAERLMKVAMIVRKEVKTECST